MPNPEKVNTMLLRQVAESVSKHIQEVDPEIIICSGKSSIVSAELYKATTPELKQKKIVTFDDKLNKLTSQNLPNLESQSNSKIIVSLLQDAIPQNLRNSMDTARVLLLDEYIYSGKKAVLQQDWLKKLGFSNVYSAFLCALPMLDYRRLDDAINFYLEPSDFANRNIFVGEEKSSEFFNFVTNLSGKASSGHITKEEIRKLVS